MASYLRNLKELFLFKKDVHNFQFFFEFSASNLEWVGLNFLRNNWKKNALDRLRTYATAAPAFFFYFCAINAVVQAENITAKVNALVSVSLGFVNVPKFFAISMHVKTLRSLVDQAIYHSNISFSSKNHEIFKIQTKYTTMASHISKFFTGNLMSISFLSFVSLIFLAKYFFLPFTTKIPGLSNDSNPGYLFHLAMTVYIFGYNVPQLFGFDLIFFYLSMFASFRLDLCKHLSANIGRLNNESDERKLLLQLVTMHIETYKFIKDCSKIISNVVLFQYFGALFLMTCSMYILLTNPDATGGQTAVYSFIGILMQFFIYCFFGQLILTKSSDFSTTLYTSCWYNLKSTSNRKTFLFFLMHTQTKQSYNAYGLFDLSYETFMQVLKASFGYFTFLKNVL